LLYFTHLPRSPQWVICTNFDIGGPPGCNQLCTLMLIGPGVSIYLGVEICLFSCQLNVAVITVGL